MLAHTCDSLDHGDCSVPLAEASAANLLRRVWISAIVCSVLPRPISSARMHPVPLAPVMPMMQRYMNCVSLEWRRQRTHCDTLPLVITQLVPNSWVHNNIVDGDAPVKSVWISFAPWTHIRFASDSDGRGSTRAPGALGSCSAPPHASRSLLFLSPIKIFFAGLAGCP